MEFKMLGSILDYIFKQPNWEILDQFEYSSADKRMILSGLKALRIPHYDNDTPVWEKFFNELLEDNIEELNAGFGYNPDNDITNEDNEDDWFVKVNEEMMLFVDKFEEEVHQMMLSFAYCITGDYSEELHFRFMQEDYILEYFKKENQYVLHAKENENKWINDYDKSNLDIYPEIENIFKEKQSEYSTKLRDIKEDAGISDDPIEAKNVKVLWSRIDNDGLFVGKIEYDYIYTFDFNIVLSTGEIWFDLLDNTDLIIFGQEMDEIRNSILEQTGQQMGVSKSVTQRALQLINAPQQVINNGFDPNKDIVAWVEYKDNDWMTSFHNLMFADGTKNVYNYLDDIKAFVIDTGRKQDLTVPQMNELFKWCFTSGFVQQTVFGTTDEDFHEVGNFSYNS